MKMKTTLLTAASCALLFTGMAHAEQTPLSGEVLKALLPGATMSGLNSRGKEWEAKFTAEGTYTLEVPSVNWSDHGTWEIEDDKYCSERTKRGRQCQIISHVDGENYLLVDERGEGMKIKISK